MTHSRPDFDPKQTCKSITSKMPGSARVYMGNVPDSARERDVEKFLKGYGKIHEISLKNGYGFVEFDDDRDADDAVHDLDGKDLCGVR